MRVAWLRFNARFNRWLDRLMLRQPLWQIMILSLPAMIPRLGASGTAKSTLSAKLACYAAVPALRIHAPNHCHDSAISRLAMILHFLVLARHLEIAGATYQVPRR